MALRKHLDKLGTTGTLLGAAVAAPACCLPLLAAAGASVGLGALAPLQGTFVYILEAFVALSVLGAALGFRLHGKWGPMAIAALSASGIYYAFNVSLSQPLVMSSLGGLVVAAVWNTAAGRGCETCTTEPMNLSSTITCPACGHQESETMPTDSCLYFYECVGCQKRLQPNSGDCCVFCSFGTVKCPPKQCEDGTC